MIKKLKTAFNTILLLISLTVFSCNPNTSMEKYSITSPDGGIEVTVFMQEGRLYYTANIQGVQVIYPSELGIVLNEVQFKDSLEIASNTRSRIDNNYTMRTGKQLENHDYANESVFTIRGNHGETCKIIFRAYNDGIAFCYALEGEGEYVVMDELTRFHVNPESYAWMQPYDWWSPAYEKEFENKIWTGKISPRHREDGWAYPALFEIGSKWMLITEADLDREYCATHVRNARDSPVYKVEMATKEQGYPGGIINPEIRLPWKSPWRVIKMGSLAEVFESNLVHHVSRPASKQDYSWVKPGTASWSWLYEPDSPQNYLALKKYVDLSEHMQWDYCLVDANWNMMKNGTIHDLLAYAEKKEIGLFLWYNSGGPHNQVTEQPRNILHDPGLRDAEFEKISKWGVKGIKVDFFESDKQDIIQLYIDILEDAARHELMVNFHGCTLPRGWQRTYPNLLTMEAVKGAEFYLMDESFTYTAGRHNTILPFTRNVVGSMDYTPVNFSQNTVNHITSHAHELALSVVFESSALHPGDRAESYISKPEPVKDFLRTVPSVWDESKLLSGYPGMKCVVARRKGNEWYIGGINGYFEETTIPVDLSFLKNEPFNVSVIKDGKHREAFAYDAFAYPEKQNLSIPVLPEGGFVIKISPR